MQILQRNVLIVFYEPFKYLRWDSPDQDVNRLRQRLRGMLFPESAGPLRDLLRDNSKHFTRESELRALLAAYHEEFGGGTPYDAGSAFSAIIRTAIPATSLWNQRRNTFVSCSIQNYRRNRRSASSFLLMVIYYSRSFSPKHSCWLRIARLLIHPFSANSKGDEKSNRCQLRQLKLQRSPGKQEG